MFLVMVGILALVALSIGELIWGDGDLLGIDDECSTAGTSCGLLQSMVLSLFPISVAVVWVFLWRLDRVRTKYRKAAWKDPADFLETKIPSRQIVGRDDLCDMLQKDLQIRWDVDGASLRRPIVLVGGVGIGKTAVLARLTQWLAERGAVPVPIRLRTANNGTLDLLDLAREKFLQKAPVLSEAEADKIWRRLWSNDQIVIVADGLEEALMGAVDTRETALRVALNDVRKRGVALIVSSRPHEALAHLDAAMVTLEPLEPQAALEYITGPDPSEDVMDRAQRIVHCADVAEMPLFMHYARELREAGVLDSSLDIRDVGRLGLRVRILDRWMQAMEDGKIEPAVPVEPARRTEVIAKLQSIAALGLTYDSLAVTFDDIKNAANETSGADGSGSVPLTGTNGHDPYDTVDATTENLRAVAADADRLGLVDALRTGVRFRHSVMQAYLGSRAITEALNRTGRAAPEHRRLAERIERGFRRGPGRELLMALSMSCAQCDEHARTRAIRLLLKNVERVGPRAVGTASAVIAAAAASTERSRAGTPRAEGSRAPAERRRGDFREGVVLWLKRAERADAERAAENALTAARAASRAVDDAEKVVSEAVVERNAKIEELAAAEQAYGEGGDDPMRVALSGYSNRFKQATRAFDEVQAAVARARRAADLARSDEAAALAELCIARTILAEKRLAEAESEPDPEDGARLTDQAETNLSDATEVYREAASKRERAARLQEEIALLPEPATGSLDAGALAELLVAWTVHSEAQLAEVEAAAASAEMTTMLRRQARAKLDEVVDTALGSALLVRVAKAGVDPGDPEDLESPQVVAELIRKQAHEAQTLVYEASDASDEAAASELLLDAARALGDPADRDDKAQRDNPRLGAGDSAVQAVATFALAGRALAGAAEARVHLESAARTDGEERQRGEAEALAALREVCSSAEVAADEVAAVGHRATAVRALPLAATAAVKAAQAFAKLSACDPGPARAAAVRDVVASLSDVSEGSEEIPTPAPANGDGASPAARATSRTQVLVPLKRTTREHETAADDGVYPAKLDAIARLSDAAQFAWLWDVCKREDDYLLRLSAARELGDGGSVAFDLIHRDLRDIQTAGHADATVLDGVPRERAFELAGWLLPLLFCSIEREHERARQAQNVHGAPAEAGSHHADEPHRQLLVDWVRRVCGGGSATSDMALAQGFRLAANDRKLARGQAGFLAARAREQLRKTDFWFSRIAIVHALTLWMLSDSEHEHGRAHNGSADREAEEKIFGLCDPGGHPLVEEAIELCAKAIRRRQPENYLWLDEGLAIAKLGAGQDAVRMGGTDAHWIPKSAGWLSLTTRAQRLLGELVVFLNLALRGHDEATREGHLRRTKPKEPGDPQVLPVCMASDDERYRLDVGRRLDDRVEPGARCAANCDMGLCPYPGIGEEMARGELSEAFCRRQHEHVRGELRKFWRQMEERPRA